jgi:putative tryptophan/tyrosine transport system substrate-binding protein
MAVFACTAGVVLAQAPAKKFRIGFLNTSTIATSSHHHDVFVKSLSELGYTEGKNLIIERRWADGRHDRLPALAAELVKSNVDVIFAPNTPAVIAARQAASNMPIVFAVAADPVGDKFVASLQRPGGNITGLTIISGELVAKRLELLSETFPKASRFGFLYSLTTPGRAFQPAEAKRAAARLGKELFLEEVPRADDIEQALEKLRGQRIDALIVNENPVFYTHRARIVQFVSKAKLPAMYGTGDYVNSGGLISYGANYADLYRRAASYVDRILKGAKAGDLPVEQPTVFELVVNQRTAKAMGVSIPRSILVRADKVIE